MTDIPFDPEIIAGIKDEIASLTVEIEEDTVAGKARAKVLSEQNAEVAKMRAIVNEMVAKAKALQDEQDAERKKTMEKMALLEANKRRLQRAKVEEETLREAEEKRKKFDEITIGAPWREWAKPHQMSGAQRLASGHRAILGDSTGLGKTLTSIIASDMMESEKILIFTPKDVILNFQSEIARWAPHRKSINMVGMQKGARDALFETLPYLDSFVLVMNYAAWRRDPGLLEHLKACQFDTIIVDEAHNMKNADTSAAKGIREIVYADNCCNICYGEVAQIQKHYGGYELQCESCFAKPEATGDFCSAKNVLCMTATGILNRPQDLFPLLNLVDRVAFPHEQYFLEDFCERAVSYIDGKERMYWTFKPGGSERLLKSLKSKYIARNRKDAGVEMPEQEIRNHWFDVDPKLYSKQIDVIRNLQELGLVLMTDENIMEISSKNPLPWYTRMRQALVWPKGIKVYHPETKELLYEADADESVVLDYTMDLIMDAIREGDRVYVPSMFKEVLKELERRLKLKNVTCVRYDGDISDEKAQRVRKDFDVKYCKDYAKSESRPDGYEWQVILGQYEKSGTGINLQACAQTVVPDQNWNPGKMDQMFGRTNRMDSLKDSVVHQVFINAFISRWMKNLVDTKRDIIDGFDDTARKSLRALMIDLFENRDLFGDS